MNFGKSVPLLLALAFTLSLVEGHAQNTTEADDQRVIKALLNEIRLLRQTFERMNLNGYRSQILVERIRAQNDKVTRLSRSVESAHEEAADAATALNQVMERSKTIEALLQQETDDKRRAALEQEVTELKYMIDVHRQREQRLREREQRASEQLRIEQGKLDDFENRLDLLEREILNEIAKQEEENKKRDSKKPE